MCIRDSSTSIGILDSALKNQKVYTPEIDITKFPPGSPEYIKEMSKSTDVRLKGATSKSVRTVTSSTETSAASTIFTTTAPETQSLLLKNNPKRSILEEDR